MKKSEWEKVEKEFQCPTFFVWGKETSREREKNYKLLVLLSTVL